MSLNTFSESHAAKMQIKVKAYVMKELKVIISS